MKAVLSKLRDKLAPQLAQQGQRTLVPRQWHNSEQRHWQKTDSAFLVAPAEFQLQESVSIPQEASEAAVLIDLVEQWISQREQNIRSLYQQVLQETGAGKSGNALASTEMG